MKKATLTALSEVASKDYGVLVERTRDVVATNGFVVFIVREDHELEHSTILPVENVKEASKKVKKSEGSLPLTIEDDKLLVGSQELGNIDSSSRPDYPDYKLAFELDDARVTGIEYLYQAVRAVYLASEPDDKVVIGFQDDLILLASEGRAISYLKADT